MKITKVKNIKESNDLEPTIYRGKKTTQHKNIGERCVTLKRIIYGYSHWNFVDIFRYCNKKIKKKNSKIQMWKLSKDQNYLRI